jgi:hypothetical protein
MRMRETAILQLIWKSKSIYDDKVAAVVTTELYDKETGNLMNKTAKHKLKFRGKHIIYRAVY